jgi:integrase
MASIKKTATGWRAQVARRGVRSSRTFPTKAAAVAWATEEEASILRGLSERYPRKTVADALERYAREVSAKKRGARAEALRLASIPRDFPAFASLLIQDVTPAEIAAWRDARRAAVSDSTVVREANTLRHVWSVARDEWGWIGESPWAKAKMPREAPARGRITRAGEIRRLVRSMGYRTGARPERPQQEVALAYLVAHHTALRAAEILGLRRSTVDLERRVIRLETHKTVERQGARSVPFTRRALRLLRLLDRWAEEAGRDAYFAITAASLDSLFRKARDRLLIDDLHFHDARASALTRLSKRMDVMRLARISGHADLRQLLGAYYRETAADIAATI